MHLVSVIIPTYNVEKEIKRCIESIINQTYKNIEIIIVDDYSTDNTVNIIKNNYKNNEKIKLFLNDSNKKAAYTRNRAINESQGELIAIQDADDYSSPLRIEKQVKYLLKNKDFSFVGSNAYSFDRKGIWKLTDLKEKPISEDFYKKKSPFVHGSILFKRKALEDVNLYRVAKETERGQDGDLLMRLYKAGFKGANIDEALYYYQENLNTVRKRSFKFRYAAVKNRLTYQPWSTLTLKEKLMISKSLIIGLIPSRLWYFVMKQMAKKSFKNEEN